MTIERTLVIPDTHDDPSVNQKRYEVIGNFIIDQQPEHIVQIGDFMSLDSISFHNHGRPLIQEGMRLVDELTSGRDAYVRMMAPLYEEWGKAKSKKKKKYRPHMVWINGNHEDRVGRYIETTPVLDGLIRGPDLVGAVKDGWEFIPYKDYVHIRGTSFTHCPLQPRTGKPLGGQYVTARAAGMAQSTIVFGHTHMRNIMACARIDPESPTGGRRVEGITVGCFLDHWPEYMAHNTGTCDWWEGLTVLHHYEEGKVDPEFISKEVVYTEWA